MDSEYRIHSFIHYMNLYSASSRLLIRSAPDSSTAKRISFHSFIHSGYLYSAPSRNPLRGAPSPATVKEKCLKKLRNLSKHVGPSLQSRNDVITCTVNLF